MDFTPPPGIDLSESQQPQLLSAYIITYSLAIIAVALRIACRLRLANAGIWWDDWAILAAAVMATGNFAMMLDWVHNGLGTHIYLYGYPAFTSFLKNLFVIEIFYTLAIVLAKYSILLFYWRIFGRQNLLWPSIIVGSIVTLWGLGVILTTIFQCLPVSSFWDKTITDSTCGVNVDNFFIGNAVPNIITDWTLLFLPLPFIWRLQRNKTQKFALCGVFLLGGFTCIISIIRLVILLVAYQNTSLDLTWIFIGPSTWTAVEINIGIFSTCLPSLKPILVMLFGESRTRPGSSKETAGYGSSHGWSKSRKPARNHYVRSVGESNDPENGSDHDLAAINVTTDIRIDESGQSRRE